MLGCSWLQSIVHCGFDAKRARPSDTWQAVSSQYADWQRVAAGSVPLLLVHCIHSFITHQLMHCHVLCIKLSLFRTVCVPL